MNISEKDGLRSDIYLLISTLLREPPSEELLSMLSVIDIDGFSSEMAQAWQQLQQAAKQSELSAVEDEYQTLFIGVGRGEVVPFASWHLTGSLMEKPLALLRRDLSDMGFEREDGVKEPEDHISALCEVMSSLITENNELQPLFFNKHIGNWSESLVSHIQQANSAHFYKAVALLVAAFFQLEKVKFSTNTLHRENANQISIKNLINAVGS